MHAKSSSQPEPVFRMNATTKTQPLLSRLDTFSYLRGLGV
jgi:hypothetical protein